MTSRRSRRLGSRAVRGIAVLVALVAQMLLTAPISAHGGGLPTVIVPLDHVVPGVEFQVLLSDFGPGATVHITIANAGETTALATATMGADGHGEASATLPPTFPFGYVQLTASSEDGSSAETWIRIADSAYTSPGSAGREAAPIWADPSVWIFGAFVLGAVAALTFLATRPHRPRQG